MRVSGFIALLAVFLAPVAVHADTGFLNRRIMVDGSMYRYQVYIPANYAASRPWPMIVYLHGNRRQGSDGVLETEGGMGIWFACMLTLCRQSSCFHRQREVSFGNNRRCKSS